MVCLLYVVSMVHLFCFERTGSCISHIVSVGFEELFLTTVALKETSKYAKNQTY